MVLIGDNDKLNLNTAARHDRAERPVRRGGLLHAGQSNSCAGASLDRNRYVIGQIVGAEQLRHRPHRAGQRRAAASPPRRRRRQQQGARLHRPRRRRSATTSRSTTWRTRWATSSPATTPSTAPVQLRRQPHAARPRSSPAPAPRSWPTPASAAGQPPAAQRPVLGPAELRGDPRAVTARRARRSARSRPSRCATSTARTRSRSTYDGKTIGPFVRGTNYTAADIQAALPGNEVQTVALDRL